VVSPASLSSVFSPAGFLHPGTGFEPALTFVVLWTFPSVHYDWSA